MRCKVPIRIISLCIFIKIYTGKSFFSYFICLIFLNFLFYYLIGRVFLYFCFNCFKFNSKYLGKCRRCFIFFIGVTNCNRRNTNSFNRCTYCKRFIVPVINCSPFRRNRSLVCCSIASFLYSSPLTTVR